MKTTKPKLKVAMSAKDHDRGRPGAAVTLIGYGDFTCPECVKAYRAVKIIQGKMGSRLRYVFRSFPQPLDSRNSEVAAEAAECASSQGKFWEMHDCIFENEGASDEFNLARYATDVGLDMKQYRSEMRKHTHLAAIQTARRVAVESGVDRLPAFFINSRLHRSAFGVITLLPAVQAAAGDSFAGSSTPRQR